VRLGCELTDGLEQALLVDDLAGLGIAGRDEVLRIREAGHFERHLRQEPLAERVVLQTSSACAISAGSKISPKGTDSAAIKRPP
jgi:hypothetical protein